MAKSNVRFSSGRSARGTSARCFVSVALALPMAFAGCSGGPVGGDPGARPLPLGTSCQSLKSELDRMVSRGVQGSIEGQASGRKLSASQKADADAYNAKLNQYLGARCHV